MENEVVTIEKDGQKIACETLFTFDSPDLGKSYIGYTDHSKNEEGLENIYVSAYNPLIEPVTLENITDPKEMEMVHNVINQIRNYN
jgi:uncharacterized protein YrzB (UPF0473 family)